MPVLCLTQVFVLMHRMLGSAASSRSDDTRHRETSAPDSLEPKPLSPIGELSPPIIPSSAVSTQVTPPLADDSTNALVKSEPDADHESNSSAGRPPGSLGSGGYVHLGAPPRHDSYSDASGRSMSSRSNDLSRASGGSRLRTSNNTPGDGTPAYPGGEQGDPSSVTSSASMSRTGDSSSENSSTDNFYKTSRFQHVETEHGACYTTVIRKVTNPSPDSPRTSSFTRSRRYP